MIVCKKNVIQMHYVHYTSDSTWVERLRLRLEEENH